MIFGNLKLGTKAFLLVGVAGLLTSCLGGGDTDGGKAGDETFDGSQFVGEGAGTIDVVVTETQLQVSDVSGFRVRIRDASGRPVPLTRVSCDSELGVAIIEPNTGVEITDANGEISGVLGCAAPGSYQFGCRMPIAGSKRDFETIRCAGPVPSGFDGFDGAGGGTLGTGGAGDFDDGGTSGNDNENGITITSVKLSDRGSTATTTSSIDTSQNGDCDNDNTTSDPEPFFDTQISFTVQNNSNSTITFSSYRYSISGVVNSGSLAFTSSPLVEPGKVTTLTSLFAKASGGSKFFYDSDVAIGSIGFKNITVTLIGVNDSGEEVRITGRTVASFDNYDNC